MFLLRSKNYQTFGMTSQPPKGDKVMLGVTKTMFLMPDIPEGDVWQSQSGNKVTVCQDFVNPLEMLLKGCQTRCM